MTRKSGFLEAKYKEMGVEQYTLITHINYTMIGNKLKKTNNFIDNHTNCHFLIHNMKEQYSFSCTVHTLQHNARRHTTLINHLIFT